MIKEIFNRHIMVEILYEQEEEKDKGFLLPEDYMKPKSPYALGKIITYADDCNLSLYTGDVIIFQRSMLQEMEIKGQKIYLILENYILGSINDESN